MNHRLLYVVFFLSPILYALDQASYERRCKNVENASSMQLKQICKKQAAMLKQHKSSPRTKQNLTKPAPKKNANPKPTSNKQALPDQEAIAPTVPRQRATPYGATNGLTFKPYIPGAYTQQNNVSETEHES